MRAAYSTATASLPARLLFCSRDIPGMVPTANRYTKKPRKKVHRRWRGVDFRPLLRKGGFVINNKDKCFFTPGSPYPPGAGRELYLDLVRILKGTGLVYISRSNLMNQDFQSLTFTAATFSSSLVRTGVPRAIMRRKLYVLQPRPHFITPRVSSRNTQRRSPRPDSLIKAPPRAVD